MSVKEFYDLAELQLNINPVSGDIESSWGNLGYWSQQDESSSPLSYPQACSQLARELANMAELNSEHAVLDTGFGCGDQLLVWREAFKICQLTGINLSVSQTEHARQKVAELDTHSICNLQAGDCCLSSAWQGLDKNFDRIIALDCIYHFSDKQGYFFQCKKHLVEDGVLVVSDLLLNSNIKSIWKKLLLKTICCFSHIPFDNFKTIDEYQTQLRSVGLVITKDEDISDQVFLPFGLWLDKYILQLKNNNQITTKFNWFKYRGTAKFLRWGYNNKIFSYHILRIEHQKYM